MGPKRFLLVPGNNSLSHIAKCLAVYQALLLRGHKARLAVGKKHVPFLEKRAVDYAVLPDIQESDDAGAPSVEWFRRPSRIIDCINAEVKLIEDYRPDRVLGVFRFTVKAAARLKGVPFDSLICGCMIPDSEETLGFADGEPGRDEQRAILDGFFRYAGSRLGAALSAVGIEKTNGDIRHVLKGDRTFLWDFPEFMPLPESPGIIHVGPLFWDDWPYDPVDIDVLRRDGRPLAVVSFGTCAVYLPSMPRIIGILLDLGYRVVVAAGGQKQFLNIVPSDPRVVTYTFAPLRRIFPYASLLVTHGGQLTVFEALQERVPVVVMPFQPEQAHNGVCLERLGCGVRLVPPQPFRGNPNVYVEALDRMTDDQIKSRIAGLVSDPRTAPRLARVSDIIARYPGVREIVTRFEEM